MRVVGFFNVLVIKNDTGNERVDLDFWMLIEVFALFVQ